MEVVNAALAPHRLMEEAHPVQLLPLPPRPWPRRVLEVGEAAKQHLRLLEVLLLALLMWLRPLRQLLLLPSRRRRRRAQQTTRPMCCVYRRLAPSDCMGFQSGWKPKIDFRLLAKCPCSEHWEHGATRTFNQAKGLCVNLGDAEAYAYLGAWLMQGPHMSYEVHKGYRPNEFEVLEYARLQNWQGEDGVWRPGDVI